VFTDLRSCKLRAKLCVLQEEDTIKNEIYAFGHSYLEAEKLRIQEDEDTESEIPSGLVDGIRNS